MFISSVKQPLPPAKKKKKKRKDQYGRKENLKVNLVFIVVH